MLLPSEVRDRFEHDPRKFVDFCVDPANIEAVRDMKLAPRPAAPAIDKVVESGSGKAG